MRDLTYRQIKYIPYGTLSNRRRSPVNDDHIALSNTVKLIITLSLLSVFIYLSVSVYCYFFTATYELQANKTARIVTLMRSKDIVDSGGTIQYNINIKKPLNG